MFIDRFKKLSSIVSICCLVIGSGCSDTPKPPTETQDFRTAFDFKPEDGWVVLSRPNNIWGLGTVVELRDGQSPKDLGTVADLNCFPDDHWVVKEGDAPQSAYSKSLDYGLSLSGTLGISKVELLKAGLNVGDDATGEKPSHKTVFNVKRATEKRVSFLKLEDFVENNFKNMSRSCKRILLDSNRYLIDKIYQIDEGALEVVENNGAKVDLALPQYKFIKDAAAKTGYSVGSQGTLTVTQPITFAVRVADFSDVLERLGVGTRMPATQSFEQAMQTANASVRY